MNRGYTVTTGVWASAVLRDEYVVDLDTITWVLSGDEHVEQYRAPGNVVPIEPGSTLEEQLHSGELAAVIGAGIDAPYVTRLIPDATEVAFAALRHRGLYPINHLVVLRNDLLRERPGLAADVFDAFVRAKQAYVDRLRSAAIESPTSTDRLYRRVLDRQGPAALRARPEPRGTGALLRSAVDQRIFTCPVALEDVLAAGTHDLNA